MKLLLTAFDPFGGSPVNPALEAVKLVADNVAGVEIVKLEVPLVTVSEGGKRVKISSSAIREAIRENRLKE